MFGQDYPVQATHSVTLLCRVDRHMLMISLFDRNDLWKHLLRLLLEDRADMNGQDTRERQGAAHGPVALLPYTCTSWVLILLSLNLPSSSLNLL